MTAPHYIEGIIDRYEQDIMGNTYTFYLSDNTIIPLSIVPEDIPHLMGVRKLPLRQVQNKSASAVYSMLKDGQIHLDLIAPFKESYMKVMNFDSLISILYCGDAVKIVRKIGSLNSKYLLYLDHRPDRIVHIGLTQDEDDHSWHPESLLVKHSRNLTKYIDGQIPVDIVDMKVEYN